MRIQLLFCSLWLAIAMGCLAPKLKAEFEADLKGWVGKPIAEFIMYKGEPAQAKLRPEGGKIYVFERNNTPSGRYKSVGGGRQGGWKLGLAYPCAAWSLFEFLPTHSRNGPRWHHPHHPVGR